MITIITWGMDLATLTDDDEKTTDTVVVPAVAVCTDGDIRAGA